LFIWEELFDAGTFGIGSATPLKRGAGFVPRRPKDLVKVGKKSRTGVEKEENMAEKNSECKCTYGCARHGNCKACQEYHRKDGSRTNCGKTGNEGGKK